MFSPLAICELRRLERFQTVFTLLDTGYFCIPISILEILIKLQFDSYGSFMIY